jgi:hypothetical protein
VGEQSHKREMMDAVRGDFERLRARRERGRQRSEARSPQPEKVVLTPAQRPAREPELETDSPPVTTQARQARPEPERRRSWFFGRRRRD